MDEADNVSIMDEVEAEVGQVNLDGRESDTGEDVLSQNGSVSESGEVDCHVDTAPYDPDRRRRRN